MGIYMLDLYYRQWRFKLNPIKASYDIYTINVTLISQSQSIILKDIVFGDLWICSGQSNMEMTVSISLSISSYMRQM